MTTVLVLLLLLPGVVLAQTPELYQAEVEVSNQTDAMRNEGMAEAMRKVLLMVSGSRQVLEDEAMAGRLQQASRYVQRYQYRSEVIPPESQRLDDAGQLLSSRLLMQVQFEPQGINNLLREHGHPVWGKVRPVTLIWMAVEEGGRRMLVGANDNGMVRQLIEDSARARALPVHLPLLDLEDQSRVQIADIWGNFHDDILQASARYNAQAVLIGRLYPLSRQQWEVRWTLLQDGEQQDWTLRSEEVATLVTSGVDQSTELLASRYAKYAQDSEGELYLHVEGVGDLRAYRQLVDHLSRTSGVRGLTLDSLNGDSIGLRLVVEGGREAMMRTIALGGVLESTAETAPWNLYYRLRQ